MRLLTDMIRMIEIDFFFFLLAFETQSHFVDQTGLGLNT